MRDREVADRPGDGSGTIQTSFRVSPEFYKRLRAELTDRNEKMSPVIQELLQEWVERTKPSRRGVYVRPYFSWLPVVAVVKDPLGKIQYANEEFLNLIGRRKKESCVGKAPADYMDDAESARLIGELDKTVRTLRKPILCVEHMSFDNKMQHRMAIRFPIAPSGELELTGVLGFNLEQVEGLTETLRPDSRDAGHCVVQVKSETKPECPLHVVRDCLHSLPAIATVKDTCGRLLCVNPEYTEVLGKTRSEVENKKSSEIWDRPFADLVMLRDELVRTNRQVYASVEVVPTKRGPRNRLNFRFPIYDDEGKLVMTGTLGFDYELIRRGIDRLRSSKSPAEAYLFDESLEQVYPTR